MFFMCWCEKNCFVNLRSKKNNIYLWNAEVHRICPYILFISAILEKVHIPRLRPFLLICSSKSHHTRSTHRWLWAKWTFSLVLFVCVIHHFHDRLGIQGIFLMLAEFQGAKVREKVQLGSTHLSIILFLKTLHFFLPAANDLTQCRI